jgi:hypothetical protein
MFFHPSLNPSRRWWLLGSNQNHARTVAWCSVSAKKKKDSVEIYKKQNASRTNGMMVETRGASAEAAPYACASPHLA